MAAKTLRPSGRGRHIHSTLPLGETSAFTSQSERKAYSAIGGNGLSIGHTRCSDIDSRAAASGTGGPSAPGAGSLSRSLDTTASGARACVAACSAAPPSRRGLLAMVAFRLGRDHAYSTVFLLAVRERPGVRRRTLDRQ